jgi:hypothetical protein
VTDTLVPAYASSPEILKLRRHLFEEVEVTLDHPGVAMSKPLDRQYQAALEVVVAHCEAVHAARVDRCITTKYQGAVTLAGVRSVAVADIIRRLGAQSQREAAVSALFLPDLARSPG